MKKLFFILILFFIIGCATGSQIVSSGKVYKGQTKSQLRDKLLNSYPGDDPFVSGSFNLYYPETREEIIWGTSRNQFYLFKSPKNLLRNKKNVIFTSYGILKKNYEGKNHVFTYSPPLHWSS